jgi:hypothetical protein
MTTCRYTAFASAFVAVALFFAPGDARAQDAPPDAASADQTVQIRGRVSSFDGGYALVVRDEQGYLDNVTLHQGTIINPTGMTLAPGMVVSVIGFNDGTSIGANEIDTPYTIYGGTPFFDGHPWSYYGPSVGFAVFFASPVWWHGAYFSGGYRVVDGRRYWAHVDRARLFAGGHFDGRRFVASGDRGWAGHGDARVLGHGPGRAIEDHRDARVAAHGPVDVHGRPIENRPGESRNLAGHGAVDVHGRPVAGAPGAMRGPNTASRMAAPGAAGRPGAAARPAQAAKAAPAKPAPRPAKKP